MISQNYIRKEREENRILCEKFFHHFTQLALIVEQMNAWCDKAMVHVVLNRHIV
jgi:hypothetical protein